MKKLGIKREYIKAQGRYQIKPKYTDIAIKDPRYGLLFKSGVYAYPMNLEIFDGKRKAWGGGYIATTQGVEWSISLYRLRKYYEKV